MARDTDGIIQEKFAENGDVSLGGLVITDGWPISYSTPGGQNPQRPQFNQLYRNLFALAVELNQKGPFLEYSATITYAINARVIVNSDVYESQEDNNFNNDPLTEPTKWVKDPGRSGIQKWNTIIPYDEGDLVVGTDDNTYKSLTNANDGNDPTSDIVNWVIAFRTAKIQPINASIAADALTLIINETELDFRDNGLASGTVNSRPITAPISLVISSGSTLGTVSAIKNRIAILAIDNGGTIELAAVNLAGGNNLDETTLITTVAEGGAGAADSANVIYSAAARVNVPFRVVGYVESTQVVAGTWATVPSTIQGYGGQAFAALSSIGYGQTWQDLTGSRAYGTNYHNSTGKPIMIKAGGQSSAALSSAITLIVDGITLETCGDNDLISQNHLYVSTIIPPGSIYQVQTTNTSLDAWSELR